MNPLTEKGMPTASGLFTLYMTPEKRAGGVAFIGCAGAGRGESN